MPAADIAVNAERRKLWVDTPGSPTRSQASRRIASADRGLNVLVHAAQGKGTAFPLSSGSCPDIPVTINTPLLSL